MSNIAVIGVGHIGEALVAGLVAAGQEPGSIRVADRSEARVTELSERYGVESATDNAQAVAGATDVFLCVKPDGVVPVLEEISGVLENAEGTVIISLAAGVTVSTMEESTPAGQPVIRVMPNTPMVVGKGMCAVAPGRYASAEQVDSVVSLLGAVGKVVTVSEKDMDAVTALSGSAPAYYFLFTEALIDAGVQLGLTRDVATQLATASATGAGALLEQEGADPVALRASVSSPGGTTVAAIRELEESGLRGAVYRAAEKCAQKSEALGK